MLSFSGLLLYAARFCVDRRWWDLCNSEPARRYGEFSWQPWEVQQCWHAG